jgi:hypothetical protein
MTTKVNDHNIETDTIVTVGVLTSLEIEGSLHAGSANLGNLVVGNYFQGNGSLLTDIAGANISGYVANATVANTVRTNAQPNITSVGTLSNLTVSGDIATANLSATGKTNLNSISNITITGGTSGQYLKTDGAGNLSFATVTVPDPLNPFLLMGA